MFRKAFKLSFAFVITTLILSASVKVFAAQSNITTNRLSGNNRYATSSAVALSKWNQSNYAVLAYGEDFPDALSAAPLAQKYNAPILLTKTNTIPEETLDTIKQLKVKNIIIIGGTGVISPAVQDKLNSMGITTTRIFGKDRYETSIKIAEQLDNVNEIAIVTGENFPNALSISPIAVKKNMAIILVNYNKIPDVVTSFINSHKISKAHVITESGAAYDGAVMNFASNTDLIIGNDKYEINLNTIDKFKSELDLSTVYLVTGENFADALSGSILAGSNSNPLILVGNNISNVKKFFANNSGSISNIKILGGTGAVKEEAINELVSSKNSTSASSSSTAPVSDTSSTSKVTNIEFVSANLTKTGAKTAAFKYKVLDQNGADITKTVSFADINAYASVGLANAAIVLDPSTGTGTITYNFSDTDEQVTVSLLYKNGLAATSSLYFDSSKAQKASIVKNIEFPATNTKKIDSNSATFYYKISNEFGTDITKMIPGSEITATGSLDSSIELNPLLGTGTITYKSSSDNGKPIAITLADKISGVKTNVTMNADGNPKINKIEVTKYLTVVNDYGISTFFAYDQYGNDISGTSLAEEITFNSDIGKVEKSNNTNLIKLIPNPGVDLSKLTKVRITGIDPNTRVSMSAELTISR